MTTTSYKAANALVEALQAEHRAASPLAALVLLPLIGQAREIEAELRRFAAARLEAEKIREDELEAARVEGLNGFPDLSTWSTVSVGNHMARIAVVRKMDHEERPLGDVDDLLTAIERAIPGARRDPRPADGSKAPESRGPRSGRDGRGPTRRLAP